MYKCTGSIMHMGEMKFKQRGEQAEADGTAGKNESENLSFLSVVDSFIITMLTLVTYFEFFVNSFGLKTLIGGFTPNNFTLKKL